MLCRRMNVSHHDAEEIVQKVLLKAWKALPEFDYDSKRRFRGWLCTVTQNSVNEFFRYAGRQSNKIENASREQTVVSSKAVCSPDIEKIAEDEWNTYLANMALANIKDSFSENVYTAFVKLSEGGSPADVAEEMAIPKNTVSVYRRRVAEKLRKEFNRLNRELG